MWAFYSVLTHTYVYILLLERQDLFALCYKKNVHLSGLPDDCYFNAYSVNWLSYNGKLTRCSKCYCDFRRTYSSYSVQKDLNLKVGAKCDKRFLRMLAGTLRK